MSRILSSLLMLALFSPIAQAQEREMRPIKAGEPVSFKVDKAYLLYRTVRPKGVPSIEPVLLRIPSKAEREAYLTAKKAAFAKEEPKLIQKREKLITKQKNAAKKGKKFKDPIPPIPSLENFDFDYEGGSNVENIDDSKALIKERPQNTHLVEVKPGDYVIYAGSWGTGMLKPFLHTCFSLGTVGFSAKAGKITDLGYWYGDGAKFKSKLPELADETGLGPSSDTPFVLISATVRPPRGGDSLPPEVEGQTIVPVSYSAVGKFFHAACGGVNRMAPVPGILDYDGGKVIDGQSGKTVPDSYP